MIMVSYGHRQSLCIGFCLRIVTVVLFACLTANNFIENKMPAIWWGQAKRRATNIRIKAVGGGIFGRFSNFHK